MREYIVEEHTQTQIHMISLKYADIECVIESGCKVLKIWNTNALLNELDKYEFVYKVC